MTQLTTSVLVLIVSALSVNIFPVIVSGASPRHSGVILLGGTGDLARKYLWQALFDAFMRREVPVGGGEGEEQRPWMFTLFAGGSSHASVATNRLKDIFDNNVKCADRHGSSSVCEAKKGEFFTKVTYFQLHLGEDYGAMCESMLRSLNQDKTATKEVLLYLAVPPSVFRPALKNFKAECKFGDDKVSVKIVLEKPQGQDWASADKLSEELLKMFKEEQLYRTDHYLAKSVVTNILPFRAANPQLEKLLNRDYVDRVEIFMKETVGVEDRYSFYNDMGVIRDVFQNHLTQLLTLIALDLPVNLTNIPSAIEQAKLQVLKRVIRASQPSTLLGQYATYTFEAAKEIPESNITALVPTFAAVMLKLRSPRWLDVPFLLVSGKKLDERSSYIRIIFKDNDVCVSNCAEADHHTAHSADQKQQQTSEHHHRPHHQYHVPRSSKKQIVFHIGHGPAKIPLISMSRSLLEPEYPDSLEEVFDPEVFSKEHSYYGDYPQNFYHATPVNNADAYSTLIEEVLQGRRQHFVSTKQLLLAWQVWDNVLAFYPSRVPRVYDAGDPASLLNFVVRGDNLEFAAEDQKQDGMKVVPELHQLHQAQTPATFLGRRMVSGTKEGLAVQLAREIEQAAESEIASKGVFHVAFSGGTTPVLLWQMLAQSFASEYWVHVHVWQVDERCVRAAADTHSNLFQLDRQLLRFVAVPWSHVHAMPVDVAGRLCDPELQGDRQYADSIRHALPNLQFDFVVLGLGADGHTASLFPQSPALNADSQTLVTVTEQGPKDTPRRMTMTLPLINRYCMK
ncbi:hypothetical protein V1264_002830 [Littorina saxatilis]|uniref:Uncharacterized protein n=1 Tax=Littorina saxatilis TaxID=31220 RepID=A0AAN9G7W5_9CAEN